MGTGEGPVGGSDYSRTFGEFNDFFEDDAACREYLVGLRWPAGYHCPRCGSSGAPWITGRGCLHCRDCGAEISVMAGTMFERTRIPLKTWFAAIWFVTSQKHGANALGLKRVRPW